MKYALAFGQTIYVKRMRNLYMTKEVDPETDLPTLEFEFLFEDVPHRLTIVQPELIHPDTVNPVERWTTEIWAALCVEFDREIEAHVKRALTLSGSMERNDLVIIPGFPPLDDEEVGLVTESGIPSVTSSSSE